MPENTVTMRARGTATKQIGWGIALEAYQFIMEEANRTGKSMAVVLDEIILRAKSDNVSS